MCIEGHPEIACATTNAMGTYRLENGLATTPECPADSPSWLDVSYCTAPY